MVTHLDPQGSAFGDIVDYIPLSCTSSPCNLLFLNLGVYALVQATVGAGTVLIWDFCVAITGGGGVMLSAGVAGPYMERAPAQKSCNTCQHLPNSFLDGSWQWLLSSVVSVFVCFPFRFNRPKDVSGCPATPEEFTPAAFLVLLLLFLQLPTCACISDEAGLPMWLCSASPASQDITQSKATAVRLLPAERRLLALNMLCLV